MTRIGRWARRLLELGQTKTRAGHDPIPYLAGGEWYVAIGTRWRDHEFRLSRDDLEQLAESIGELLQAVDEFWPEPGTEPAKDENRAAEGGRRSDGEPSALSSASPAAVPAEHSGGNSEECEACDLTPSSRIDYPWHCPGPGEIVRGPGETPTVWWMYANDDDGVLTNIGSQRYVEGHMLALPVVRVEVRLVDDGDQDATHWGWIAAGGETPTLIWPSRAQFTMCFPYGPAADEAAGRGRAVRLAVSRAGGGVTPSEWINRRSVERLIRRMEAEGGG